MGVSLRSSSKDEGSSRVWMALLEQHNPSSPVFQNLRRFIDAVTPTAPTTGLPLQGNPVATADANQNFVTIIRHSFLFLARSLASLISIILSFRALFTPSIHPKLSDSKFQTAYSNTWNQYLHWTQINWSESTQKKCTITAILGIC